MVVVRVVAAHDLASFEQRVGLIGMRLAPWDRVRHRRSDQGELVFSIVSTAQPVRDGPPPHVGILTEKFQAV